MLVRSLFIGFVMLSGSAHAEMTTVWSFTQSQLSGQWSQNGLTAAPTPQGLHLQTSEGGGMFRPNDSTYPIDAVRFTFAGTAPKEVNFLWHPHNTPPDNFRQYAVPVETEPGVMTLDMTKIENWDPRSDIIGFAVGPGTDATLVSLEFLHWNLWEKITEGWKSFWMFDTLSSYSINFLWGPLLTFTPIERVQMFQSLPPVGLSAVRVFYSIIALGALILAAIAWWKRRSFAWYLRACIVIVALAWVFFDVRMGAELLSANITDMKTYVTAPIGEKNFRNYQNFHDALFQSMPLLRQSPHFGLLTPYDPLVSLTRYYTYPSLPVRPGESANDVRYWFVFRGDLIKQNEDGSLADGNGQVITPPGKILKQFDETSFLFEVL